MLFRSVYAEAKQIDVRNLLPDVNRFELDSPVRSLTPTLDFSEIEILATDWRSIAGFSTEDCSSFSAYVVDEFGHLAMDLCSLSFLKRSGKTFIIEFCGEAGKEECGFGIPFRGLIELPLGGIGMYFPPSEKNPVEAGRRLLEHQLPDCSFETFELELFPRNAPRELTHQRLVFLPS